MAVGSPVVTASVVSELLDSSPVKSSVTAVSVVFGGVGFVGSRDGSLCGSLLDGSLAVFRCTTSLIGGSLVLAGLVVTDAGLVFGV